MACEFPNQSAQRTEQQDQIGKRRDCVRQMFGKQKIERRGDQPDRGDAWRFKPEIPVAFFIRHFKSPLKP